jgi:phage terminase small subunit
VCSTPRAEELLSSHITRVGSKLGSTPRAEELLSSHITRVGSKLCSTPRAEELLSSHITRVGSKLGSTPRAEELRFRTGELRGAAERCGALAATGAAAGGRFE